MLVAMAAVCAAATPAAGHDDGRRRIFSISSPEITESSSLLVSSVAADLAYTTNDSGDTATIYALDTSNGTLVGRTSLDGVDPVDVEALAGGSDGSVVVADIGDNDAVRDSVHLYQLPQPRRGDTVSTPREVELTYVDGARDAESAVYDADTGRVYIVSKELVNASVYVTPPHVFERARAVLKPVAHALAIATDATLLPGGDFAVVRSYGVATIYHFPSFERVKSFRLPPQQQGESVAAPSSGGVVWVGSEGKRSPVLAVRLPGLSKPQPTPSTQSPGRSTSNQDTSSSGDRYRDVAQLVLVAAGVGFGLLLVGSAVVGVVSRRR